MTMPDNEARDPLLTRDQRMQLATLREALMLGERSGQSRPFNFVAFLASKARAGQP